MKKFILLALIIYAIFNPETIQAPTTSTVMAQEVVADPRIEKLEQFLRKYNSPLANSVDSFISVADSYNIDWRILPAISGAESTFARHTPSCAGFNPFGWSSSTSPCGFWRFESYDEAIRTVGTKISTGSAYSKYQRSGKIEDLALSYNPSGQEAWIDKVSYFMEELK